MLENSRFCPLRLVTQNSFWRPSSLPSVMCGHFFSGWTMAAHPGSFSSCCPESCSTRTMDCLNTLPLTATLCKSAHSRPLWRTLMNGQWTCRKYSSKTLGFGDHASWIWPLSFKKKSLFLWEVQMRENREEVKAPWWVCLGLHALMTLDFRYCCVVLFWFYYGQC